MMQASLRFGAFQLDPPNARLLRGSLAIALQPKAFDVLAYLAENAGRLVTQDELIDAIWPDTIVGDSSLKSCIRQIRQALGDPARQPQFIETVHRRGYRFIAPIAKRDEPAPAPAADGPLLESPQPPPLLVGRSRELLQLHAWLTQALSGERQIVFVTGGPGSGKTTLVEAFEHHAAADVRVWIASGQCFEHFGSGEAYLPVLEAVGRLARGSGGQRLLRLLADHAPTWLAQLPGLSQRLGSDGSAAEVPGASPERMLREMAEALEALTAETPLALVLEDLHWGDYSTLDLVSALARRQQPARLLVLATYRPVEAVLSGHPLRAVKQDLQARRLCHEIPLGLLDEAAVADYLAARFPGGGLPTGLARLLHARTEGNPLFLVNLVDYWLAQGALISRHGEERRDGATSWELGADLHALDLGVPASIRSLIEKQLERLSPEELRILEGASVAGVEFASAAAAAAADQDVLSTEEHCERLVRQHHFLQAKGLGEWPDGTVSARYRFGHELYHRVVYERVAAARRRRLHERLGQRLEVAYGAKADEIAAELALHFEQARDPARAAGYLGHAADRAARHFAHREAVDYLRRALRAVERLPETERAGHELRLQVRLGLQLQITKGFAAPEAQQAYLRARELFRHVRQTTLQFPVLWGLWLSHKVRSELPKAREMAEELHALATELGEPALILQSQQAFAVTTLCLGQPSATRQHMEHATALYDPQRHQGQTFLFGQDPGVACLAFGSVALWLLGYPDQAVQKSGEATRLSHELSQPSSQALALHFAAMVHQCRGDGRSTLASAELVLAIAADQGFSFWHAGGTVFRGWALSQTGSDPQAIALLQEGLEAWDTTGSVTYRTYFLALLAEALEKMGRVGDALEAVEEAIALAERTSEGLFAAELHRLRGQMLCRLGQAREAQKRAKEEFESAREIARQQEAKSLELRAVMSLCRCYEEQGRLKSVRPLLAESYDWFTEGFDTPDLQAARSLLQRTAR
jgi:DNA-binding winged helix-turn-helix (wHTH) protein/predicted ATPase